VKPSTTDCTPRPVVRKARPTDPGVTRTVKLTDALIAATAIEHALPIITQDRNYDQMAAAYPDLAVVRA
jgi:predicted nucleic acid-binding protein